MGRLPPFRESNLESVPSSEFGAELPFPITENIADAVSLIGDCRPTLVLPDYWSEYPVIPKAVF